MEISEKELWKAMDESVFGTSDQAKLKSIVENQLSELERLQSSLGGFLYLIREMRALTVTRIAAQVGISEEKWEMWEGDVCVPTSSELDSLTQKLGLWRTDTALLLKLWHRSSFESLRRLVKFRPQLLAARGVAALTTESQWDLLHPRAQMKLAKWGDKNGFSLPNDLFEMLDSLQFEREEELTAWAQEVWNDERSL